MKIFKKVFKNKLFYLVLLLGVFLTPIFKFTLQAQEVYDNGFNLASPDLENKEYLGEGEYRLYGDNQNYFNYNVYTGIYTLNGEVNIIVSNTFYKDFNLEQFVYSFYYESGTYIGNNINFNYWNTSIVGKAGIQNVKYDNKSVVRTDLKTIYFLFTERTFDNYKFKLQLEKGDTTTPYKLPIQALYDHAYNDGLSDGYDEGYNDAFDTGYDAGRDYGQYLGYNEARDEYGIFINGEWISATDYGALQYNDGYQDGEGDTHDYYNDIGLFIPRTTPKAHLVVDYDQRYGEPYFYLQDFSGDYDPLYFDLQHNRWLENAFDWAYSVQEDFLAINDLYAIPYGPDEVIYKYFFYKYDTDNIYFYNDNGTLLEIVDRALFDYYVYEVPELSQEVQALIDNAYNRGMWDYGYYDPQSEEYLTATEYGEIQYNKGVISTRDKAYSDGFMVGVWDSHRYGYDWVRVTYYELIAERPILNNVSDLTSFAYNEGYGEGFDDGEYIGYGKGYEVGLDDGYDDGLVDGFDDGYEVGYWKGYDIAIEDTPEVIYDEIYNKGYRDGQKTGMNNKFYTGLEKWIVPAIIVVLFFGLLMLFPRNKED